jgi:hypothetical protein
MGTQFKYINTGAPFSSLIHYVMETFIYCHAGSFRMVTIARPLFIVYLDTHVRFSLRILIMDGQINALGNFSGSVLMKGKSAKAGRHINAPLFSSTIMCSLQYFMYSDEHEL